LVVTNLHRRHETNRDGELLELVFSERAALRITGCSIVCYFRCINGAFLPCPRHFTAALPSMAARPRARIDSG
jgi:hypothetical protein